LAFGGIGECPAFGADAKPGALTDDSDALTLRDDVGRLQHVLPQGLARAQAEGELFSLWRAPDR